MIRAKEYDEPINICQKTNEVRMLVNFPLQRTVRIALLVEHSASNTVVLGSSPVEETISIYNDISQFASDFYVLPADFFSNLSKLSFYNIYDFI